MMTDDLIVKELTFSAAHYLPNHPKCGVIHGHTYFVRNLEVRCVAFVDFHDIIKAIMDFDHSLLVSKAHFDWWLEMAVNFENIGIKLSIVSINGDTTVENIKKMIGESLERIDGVAAVLFELYEGPNFGVKYP